MSKKFNIISLGKIDRRIFIILIGGILYTGLLFVEQQSSIIGGEELKHPIIYSLMNSLSLCLSFIPLIIYYKKNTRRYSLSRSTLIENNFRDKAYINKKKEYLRKKNFYGFY